MIGRNFPDFARRIARPAGAAIWRLYRACARATLRFVRPSPAEREAVQRLRAEIASLPPIAESSDSDTHPIWIAGRILLRESLLTMDPRGFLTWDIIAETMFPPFGAFAREELAFLRGKDWNAVWRKALKEPPLGLPFPALVYPRSSTNTIHHAYHLCRFESESFSHVRNYSAIFEFGGGFGSLCRICHAIGFAGKYVIFDLPEQSALQRYYLSSIGLGSVITVSDMSSLEQTLKTLPNTQRLFLATWSLSESAVSLRRKIAKLVEPFEAFLISYQETFPGIDNVAFFREWQSWFPEVTWSESAITHLPGNRYLFGVKK